jgi:hypothetical protein
VKASIRPTSGSRNARQEAIAARMAPLTPASPVPTLMVSLLKNHLYMGIAQFLVAWRVRATCPCLTIAQIASRHATYQGTANVGNRFLACSGLPTRGRWQDVSEIALERCERYLTPVADFEANRHSFCS